MTPPSVLSHIPLLNKLALIALILCKLSGIGTAAFMLGSLANKTLMNHAYPMLYMTLGFWALAFLLPTVQWLREIAK